MGDGRSRPAAPAAVAFTRLRKPGPVGLGLSGARDATRTCLCRTPDLASDGGGACERDPRLSGRGGITNSVCGFPRMAARLSTLGCMGVGSYDRKQHEPMHETGLGGAALRSEEHTS